MRLGNRAKTRVRSRMRSLASILVLVSAPLAQSSFEREAEIRRMALETPIEDPSW